MTDFDYTKERKRIRTEIHVLAVNGFYFEKLKQEAASGLLLLS